MKALIDTNIWLDYSLRREPFDVDARAALLICNAEDIELFTAATSVKDVFYVVSRKSGIDMAYSTVEQILDISEPASVDSAICNNALLLERPDYEDGIIAAVAEAEKVDVIISRDADAFTDLDIPKYSPKEFIEHMGYTEMDF